MSDLQDDFDYDDRDNDFEDDDFGNYPDDDDHGGDCDCEECTYERAMDECSYMPEHGGCLSAGSEFCDFECPHRRYLDKLEAKGDDDE